MSIDAPSAITIPASLQAKVHAMIQAIGGYWRPVNAVARLLEELGELGEQLTTADATATARNSPASSPTCGSSAPAWRTSSP